MKKIAISLLLLAMVPLQARALNTSSTDQVMSYVAMPLAVSAVCDVRGVQTDRVGELVGYMNQASVAPTDFVDVFRYVPVALGLRTDGRPDFVEWVGQQVDQGVIGTRLVTLMEQRLRTYDNYVPVSTYRSPRRQPRYSYNSYAFESDYVPVAIRRHCEREILEPLSLIEMPVAVANVYDLRGVPYDRFSNLVVELNLADVPPLQFVELVRYAPAALVVDNGYYGQPDFVEFVRAQRVGGITGYRLVSTIDQQFPRYGIAAQIDLSPPVYVGQTYSAPVVVNYVPPLDPMYVPAVVQTRVASSLATSGGNWTQPAPTVAVSPQVTRLLHAPSGQSVVVNPGQARRELARNRVQREAQIAAAPPASFSPVPTAAPAIHEVRHGRGHERVKGPQSARLTPVREARPTLDRGRGHHFNPHTPPAPPQPASVVRVEKGHGHEHHAIAAPVMARPATVQPAVIREHGNGHRHPAAAAPPAVVAPPAAAGPVVKEHGHGAPAATAPAHVPPGQEKKGKGKG